MITHAMLPSPKYLVLVFLVGLFCLLFYALDYLTYTDKPEKSDAVVFFVGPDRLKRQKEVDLLFTDGYAEYLIVPAHGTIQAASPLPFQAILQTANSQWISSAIKFEKYFENTHIEVLKAKRMMEQYGLKSAIFVSSPYHMRRIKIISEKIFDDQSSRIVYIPTRFESFRHNLLHLTMHDWSNIINEYVKIIWFLIYSPFTEL